MDNDLRHLRWKLMNHNGLSYNQANKRIEELKTWEQKNLGRTTKKISPKKKKTL